MPITPHKELDDVQLFRRAKSSEGAFEQLYRAYAPVVYTWFRRHVTQNPAEAADLTAELFARAILSIRKFRGERLGSGTAWLFGIARHLAADYVRTKQIECRARARLGMVERYSPDASEDADLRLSAEQSSSELASAFEKLTRPQQIAIRSRVLDELPYEEIAERMGSTSQAARLHVMRGLRRLRELIPKFQQEDGS